MAGDRRPNPPIVWTELDTGGDHVFRDGTVIVLGAAISSELDMPLGWKLKTRIAEALPGDGRKGSDRVRETLFYGGNQKANTEAVRMIRAALPRAASIDNLIEHLGADPALKFCAKVGIIAAIVDSERRSKIWSKNKGTFGQISAEDSSYADLFRIMVGSVPKARLADAISRVSFVNFNYDRCLEHYMLDWLVGYSGLSPAEAASLVKQLKVVRPYGTIGPLPALQPGGGSVAYGEDLEYLDLSVLASNILTFSEERGTLTDLAVREMTGAAEQLIFLGCHYHPQNIQLLSPTLCRFRRAFGTCYVPPPADPNNVSAPSIVTFAEPTQMAFHRTLSEWNRRTPSADILAFEPLTCKQLIAKFGPLWIDA